MTGSNRPFLAPDLEQALAITLGRKAMGTRVRKSFHNDGIRTLSDLLSKGYFELMRLPNIGSVSVKAIVKELAQQKLYLKGDERPLVAVNSTLIGRLRTEAMTATALAHSLTELADRMEKEFQQQVVQ